MTETAAPVDLAQIEAYLRRDPFRHLYGLGDLDRRFRGQTTWYTRTADGGMEAVALLYRGVDPPSLLALAARPNRALRLLLHEALPSLPAEVQCHLSAGLADVLAHRYRLSASQPHLKMGLLHRHRLDDVPDVGVVRLTEADGDELMDLYRTAYPDNAYDPDLLATGCFRGIRLDGQLVSAAGVHVYSETYRVAALGSVATHPLYRGRGLARAATAALCRDLLDTADHIGLNVRADNRSAIACYRALGFETTHHYTELLASEGHSSPADPN